MVEQATADLLARLASQGILGILLSLSLVWLYLKDRDLGRERAARIKDAKDYTDLALKLQERVMAATESANANKGEMVRIADDLRRLYNPGPGVRR